MGNKSHDFAQVVCRDCCLVSHSGHALANASRAAAERARLLRDACERAKLVPENVERAARNLSTQAYEIDVSTHRILNNRPLSD